MDKVLNRIGKKEHEGVHAVIIKDGKILRGLREYESGVKWIIPGGRCEDNETLAQALRREIKEETGIEEYKVVKYLGQVEGIHRGYRTNVFVVNTDDEPNLMEKEKFAEWKWMSLKESEKLGANPRITELIKKNFQY